MKVPNWISQVPFKILNGTQRTILLWYASHAANFTAYQNKLAEDLGLHRKTIHRNVAKLVSLGLLDVDKEKTGEHKIYRFVGWDKAHMIFVKLIAEKS